MKKLIILAAVATLFASCASIEPEQKAVVASVDQPISFQVATQMAATKAQTAFPTSSSFVSLAYYADNLVKNMGDPFYVSTGNKETVTWQSTFWSTSGNKYYWPKKGTLTFLAYAPATPAPSVTPTQLQWSEVTPTVDLLYAKKAIKKGNADDTNIANVTGMDKGVTTIFQHATAQVQVKVVPAYLTDGDETTPTTWKIKVKSYSLGKVYTTGTCTLAATNLNTDWGTPSWAGVGETAVLASEEFATAKELTSTSEGVEILAQSFVIPQTLDENVKISIVADIETYRDGVLFNTVSNYEFKGDLSAAINTATTTAVSAWTAGTSYTYTIKVVPADSRDNNGNPTANVADALIKFDPVTEDWVPVNCTLTI